jgi:hypothetical protein
MFIFAGKLALTKINREAIDALLLKNPQSRLILALIDFYYKLEQKDELLAVCETDRAARLDVIHRQEKEFSKRLQDCEKDREARLEVIHNQERELLNTLKVYEADRAALVEVINNLRKQIDER